MESPIYFGAIAAARAAGLRPVPVPTDADGVRPDLLDAAFERSGARLFSCQPRYAHPTGTVLPPERRPLSCHRRRAQRFRAGGRARGVLVTPGRHAFPADPPAGCLRLSYAMVEAEWVDEAAAAVAAAATAPGEAG